MNINQGVFVLGLQIIAVIAISLVTAPITWAQTGSIQCAATAPATSISLTDWETGLGAWDVGTHDVARPATFDTSDWAVVGNLPGGRSGNAAFVANLDTGDCGADDESGALTLTSPEIVIPANASDLRISFNHWFHIEYGWDGGNLKISVNGGPYDLVPTSAFLAGAYTATLFEAFDDFGISYNTNPLAEQDAFTGPESEQATGSWSESRIDLLGIAGPGDTIRLQFDFGVDACDGKVGWYVDEVEVYGCIEELPQQETSLTLVKRVVNDNGGSAPTSVWTLTAAGPTGFSGPGPSVSSGSNFQPGTYDLSESGGPAGYAADGWVCSGGTQVDADTITLEAGVKATCTITNDDIAPTLQLVKSIVNDNGGTVTNPDDFGLRIDGDLVENNSKYTLSAGSHQASEDGLPGYQPGPWGGDCAPDGSISLVLGQDATCTITNDDIDPAFQINAGLNDAWYNPLTDGQGFFVTVYPDAGLVFLSWFTYDTILPPEDAMANLGDPGHRWMTAVGTFSGNQAVLNVTFTSAGLFDTPTDVVNDSEGQGTITLTFTDCLSGTVEYSITPINQMGTVPIQRIVNDNVALCETLQDDAETQDNGDDQQISYLNSDVGNELLDLAEMNAGLNDAWFDPVTDGQGFFITVYPDIELVFLSWFTFDTTLPPEDAAYNLPDTGNRWLTAAGQIVGNQAVMDIDMTSGGLFDQPSDVQRTDPPGSDGTIILTFENCNSGTVEYDITSIGQTGTVPIERIVTDNVALCDLLGGQ
ncbi:hypothetical protein ACFL07_02200 [Pseudomonadota bacterium]